MVFLLLFSLFALPVFGAETVPEIYVNEVQIEPTQQVEIVNKGVTPVDLSGWFIDDSGGTTYVTIEEGTVILPDSCIVIEGSFNLNKASADTIRLFNTAFPPTSSQAVPADEYSYSASPGEMQSFQRTPDGSSDWIAMAESLGKWNSSLANCQIVSSPTPVPSLTFSPTVVLTPTPTKSPSVTNIRISEVMVYPSSAEPEWIELYNPNNFETVLLNWSVDDIANGGASPKKFTLTIPAKSFGIFELSSGIFNNSGDSVRLLNSDQQLIDSFSYTDSMKEMSIGKTDNFDSAYCFQEPTKGYENESCLAEQKEIIETSSPSPSISEIPVTPYLKTKNENFTTQYYYHPIIPTSVHVNSDILGLDDNRSLSNNKNERKPFQFIPSVYSLLSIISLAVKMKLK